MISLITLAGCVATVPNNGQQRLEVATPNLQKSKLEQAQSQNSGIPMKAGAQVENQAPKKGTPMPFLVKDGSYEKAKFCPNQESVIKGVNAKGLVTLKSGKSFKLMVDKRDVVESVAAHDDEKTLTIGFEASFGGDGIGKLCKYQLSNLKRLWCMSFGMAQEIFVSSAGPIYVAGYDSIDKVDQNTGKSLWVVPGLSSSHQVEMLFKVPVEEGENIIFYSTNAAKDSSQIVKKLVLNARTGKIVSNQKVPSRTQLPIESDRKEGRCS